MAEAAPIDARPLRADAARNRERILETAEAVLATQGLSTPIDDIAREAGVGIGTVYRHFPTKEALFEAVVVNRVQRLIDEAEALADADDPGEAFFAMLEYWVVRGTAHKALVEGLADSGFDVKAATAGAKQQLHRAMALLLERAQAAGDVRTDVDIDDVMALIAGACHASVYAGLDADAQARTVAVLSDGLRPTPARKRATRSRRQA
jgi:AcrR family transcriptional regulator